MVLFQWDTCLVFYHQETGLKFIPFIDSFLEKKLQFEAVNT